MTYTIDTKHNGTEWIATFGYDASPDGMNRDAGLKGRGDTEADAIVDLITEEGALTEGK